MKKTDKLGLLLNMYNIVHKVVHICSATQILVIWLVLLQIIHVFSTMLGACIYCEDYAKMREGISSC